MSGSSILETITYHCLAIGFICMALRDGKKDKGKKEQLRFLILELQLLVPI